MPQSLPIKILHLINGEYYAGAERVQDLLAKNLPDHGYEVSFACLKPVAFPNSREYKDAPLLRLPMRSPFDLRLAHNLIQLIKEQHFALIHTHYTRSNLLGSIASIVTGVPFIQHIHGVIGFDSATITKKYLNILVERVTMLLSRRIILVSEHLRSTIRPQSLLQKKIQVIHNGVPVHRNLPVKTLSITNPVIGTVAFWRPGKGLEELFHALHQLITVAGQSLNLHVVGGFISPLYERKIKAMAETLHISDHIHWAGPTSDVDAFLREMDLFVLPSLSEGLPMVILEAMAAGVPVVATDVGGISEAIRSRVDGLLVPAQDPNSLAEAIKTLLNDAQLWTSCRVSAHKRQTDQFSDKHMASEVAKTYSQLLGLDNHGGRHK